MNHDFYAYYSTLSNIELLDIQANQQNYQPEAVEAARLVLQSRTVTGEDHQALEEIAASEKQQALHKKEKSEALKAFVEKAADTIRPGKEKTARQQLLIFCAGLSVLFLLGLPRRVNYLYFLFIHHYGTNIHASAIATGFILTPVEIYLLYKQRKWGWIICAFLFTINVLIGIICVLMMYNTHLPSRLQYLSGSIYAMLTLSVISIAVLYYINTPRFMTLFQVTTKQQFTTIIVSSVIGLMLVLYQVSM